MYHSNSIENHVSSAWERESSLGIVHKNWCQRNFLQQTSGSVFVSSLFTRAFSQYRLGSLPPKLTFGNQKLQENRKKWNDVRSIHILILHQPVCVWAKGKYIRSYQLLHKLKPEIQMCSNLHFVVIQKILSKIIPDKF